MQRIINNNPVPENYDEWTIITQPFLDKLNRHPKKNRRKIIETCHLGKLLMLLANGDRIEGLSEEPDFIIDSNGLKIGVEHQTIVDPSVKETEGFIENIFLKIEANLQNDASLPNFFASCFIRPNLSFKLADRKRLLAETEDTIRRYQKTNLLFPNSLIDRISIMPHSQINVSPNFGAWWQKWITEDLIKEAVAKKELKLPAYRKNCNESLWLLVVIGSVGESSYEVETNFSMTLDTEFDKVYLLEDFKNRLFEIK